EDERSRRRRVGQAGPQTRRHRIMRGRSHELPLSRARLALTDLTEEDLSMRRSTPLAIVVTLLSVFALGGPLSAQAQDRAKTKEVVVAFAAEPRTLLPNTIVDWTTNDQVEHIYDRLVDRDAKNYKPAPMLATGWKIVNDTTWEFTLRQGVKFQNGEPFN